MRPLLLALLACHLLAAAETAKPWGFEQAVANHEQSDRERPPQPGGIAFIGSSTFTMWKSLAASMAPLPAYNRAFGGSRVSDMLLAAPRIIIPNKPAIVVYYCGDNNLTSAKADPQVAVQGFADFVALIRAGLPGTRIVYVSIKPSPSRWDAWPRVSAANAAIRALCDADPKLLTFVDLAPVLLGEDGQPIAALYRKDRLHLTEDAYARVTGVLKPVLERLWSAGGGGR